MDQTQLQDLTRIDYKLIKSLLVSAKLTQQNSLLLPIYNYFDLDKLSELNQAKFFLQTLDQCRQLAAFLSYTCPNPNKAFIGLFEIFTNAVEHGNLGISYEEKSQLISNNAWLEEIESRLKLPENRQKKVFIHYSKTKQTIQFRIQDQGKGFNWFKYQDNSCQSQSRGIYVAKNLSFDKLIYQRIGNEVLCIVNL